MIALLPLHCSDDGARQKGAPPMRSVDDLCHRTAFTEGVNILITLSPHVRGRKSLVRERIMQISAIHDPRSR